MTTTRIRTSKAVGFLAVCFTIFVLAPAAASAKPGDLDPKFGGDGRVEISIGQIDKAQDLLFTSGRRVVVAKSDGKLALVALDRLGERHPAFGINGLVTQTFPKPVDSVSGTVDPQGRIVVVISTKDDPGVQADSYLMRYMPDGKLDRSFGFGGFVGMGDRELKVVSATASGISVAGRLEQPTTNDSTLVFMRRTLNGAADTSWGGFTSAPGELTLTTRLCRPLCSGSSWSLTGLVTRPDGSLVASGDVGSGSVPYSNAGIALITPSGRGSTLRSDLYPGAVDEHAGDLVLRPSGGMLLAGSTIGPSGDRDALVAALRTVNSPEDGSPDPGFGANGFQFVNSSYHDRGQDIATDQQGRVYLAGEAIEQNCCHAQFFVARLLSHGAIDSSFGQNGRVITSPRPMANAGGGTQLVIDKAGRPIVAGSVGAHISVFRYKAGK
jgi:uncharacterized delta-60 repeat protein